jgi:adenylate kinase family enzyme
MRNADDPFMKRVLVIGSGGAGKSTFAAQLAEMTELPLIHLDEVYWKAGWIEPSREEWQRTTDRLLAGGAWVMDGNYGGTLERRLAACDTVFFLDVPRMLCLWRVLRRYLRFRGGNRPGMAAGCNERLTWRFAWWILSYPELRRPAIMRRLDEFRVERQVIELRSRRQVAECLAGFPRG